MGRGISDRIPICAILAATTLAIFMLTTYILYLWTLPSSTPAVTKVNCHPKRAYSFREFGEEIIQRKAIYDQLSEVKPNFHTFGSRKYIFEHILRRYFVPLRIHKPISHLARKTFMVAQNRLKFYMPIATDGISISHWPVDFLKNGLGRCTNHLKIIEVGAYKGNFTNDMAISCRNFNLSCIIIAIDTWHYVDWMRGYDDPEQSSDQIFFEQYLSNIVYFNNSDVVAPYRATTKDAYVAFKCAGVKADLIYVDADHSFQNVYDDMRMYYDLLTDNGIIFGDDVWFPEVKRAVDAFAKLRLGSIIDISHKSVRTWLVEKAMTTIADD